MATTPRPVGYEVTDGSLRGLRFGSGSRVVLAAHGITASAMSWPAVATALPEEWSLVALDLRGRGASRELTGEAGLRTHAADVVRVAEALRDEAGTPTVLAGHSMGAFVAVHAAHDRPELFSRVVLVDGGVALPLPDGADPDAVLEAALGPAIERLSRTFGSIEEYIEFFRAHPALGPSWSEVIEDYVRYDALETSFGIRSRAVEAAVRADGRDLLVSGAEFDPELRATPLPIEILAAPLGMMGAPPGLLPTDALAAYDDAARVRVETIPETNHYTVLFDPRSARRVAEVIAAP